MSGADIVAWLRPESGQEHALRRCAQQDRSSLTKHLSAPCGLLLRANPGQPQPTCLRGMAGRYTGSYLDRSSGSRATATLAEVGQASLLRHIPTRTIRALRGKVTIASAQRT